MAWSKYAGIIVSVSSTFESITLVHRMPEDPEGHCRCVALVNKCPWEAETHTLGSDYIKKVRMLVLGTLPYVSIVIVVVVIFLFFILLASVLDPAPTGCFLERNSSRH